MMNGILRIQTYRPRQSAPVEGVTVVITGSGFTAHRITDAEGNAEDVAICAPACALSLDENNTTTLPYAVCSLMPESRATAPSASRASRSLPGRSRWPGLR